MKSYFLVLWAAILNRPIVHGLTLSKPLDLEDNRGVMVSRIAFRPEDFGAVGKSTVP